MKQGAAVAKELSDEDIPMTGARNTADLDVTGSMRPTKLKPHPDDHPTAWKQAVTKLREATDSGELHPGGYPPGQVVQRRRRCKTLPDPETPDEEAPMQDTQHDEDEEDRKHIRKRKEQIQATA